MKAKWNPGPFSHVWRFFTRRGRRSRVAAGYDFQARYAACVRAAELEAARVDELLAVRAR